MGRRETMTLKKFVAEYSGAPLDDYEFAAGAALITDCEPLRTTAQAFLDAKREFLHQLTRHEVEIG
jgi:hypothetical protein